MSCFGGEDDSSEEQDFKVFFGGISVVTRVQLELRKVEKLNNICIESIFASSFNSSFSVQNPRALTSFLESVGVLLFAFLGPCLPSMLVILSGEQLHHR